MGKENKFGNLFLLCQELPISLSLFLLFFGLRIANLFLLSYSIPNRENPHDFVFNIKKKLGFVHIRYSESLMDVGSTRISLCLH